MRLVIDTNVLVSALLTPTGVPARLMERVATGGHEVLLDKRILDEYRRVLERPEFSFEVTVVRSLLDALETSGMMVSASPLELRLIDPDDLPFLEVAVSGRAHALVTGNGRQFVPVDGTHSIHIVSPRDGLELVNV